jgi:CHAT domain-containing protein
LSEPRPGFASLPHTLDEVAAIEALFGGVVLSDGAFSAAALAREVERTPFSVVHIASHGVFRGAGAESFILSADGRLSLDALDRLLAVARYRETPVELLTLSACQTAAGDAQAALGLAGVAVKAGARSALASLWSVNDESSAELLTAFYRELARGDVGRAEALRRAQIAQRASPRFGHPAYWAAFVMIGNWL